MIIHYLKTAWRTLFRYRMQSAISISGVAVGLLCFGLCMYIVRYVVSIDAAFPHHKRLVEVILKDDKNRPFSGTPAFVASTLNQHRLNGIEAYSTTTYDLVRNVEFEVSANKRLPFQVCTMEVDSCFTDLFSSRFVYGSRQTAFDRPDAVILTESMSRRAFGESNPVGKQLISYGPDEMADRPDDEIRAVYVVTGVIEDLPENTSLSYRSKMDVLFYNDSRGLLINREIQESRTGCNTYALMRPGADLEGLNRQVGDREISVRLFDKDLLPVFTPIGREFLERTPYLMLAKVLSAIGVLILLSALLNFYVFTVGQFYNRLQEFSIRKSVGGAPRHLFFMLFTEIALMLLIALFIVLCVVEWLYPESEIPLGFRSFPLKSGTILMQLMQYLGGLFLLSALICAYVARRVDKMNLQTAIRGGNRRYVRNGILGLQLFICLLFIGGSVALQMQTDKLVKGMFSTLTTNEKKGIFMVSMDFPQLRNDGATLLRQIRQNSSVAEVLETGHSLLGVTRTGISPTRENFRNNYFETQLMYAGPNFTAFFKIPILQGTLPQQPGQVLVNSVLAARIDSVSAIGKSVYNYSEEAFSVAGICDNLLSDGRYHMPNLLIRMPEKVNYCYVKAIPGKEQEVKAFLEQSVRRFLPETIDYRIFSFEEALAQEQMFENNMRNIITFLAIVCLVITLLGIYSSVTLDTARRQKEVAVRKINGAGIGVLIWLFGRFYLVLLLAASAVALPLLWLGLDMWLQNYTISISYGPLFFIGLLLLTALFIGLTIVSRIVRIVRLNPATVIKNE